MKIGIDMGHSLKGAGSGAVGVLKETDVNRRVGKLVIAYLKQLGHTVVNCTVDSATSENEQLREIVKKENAQRLDWFISIHLNAFNGRAHGTETYILEGASSKTRNKAKVINDAIVNSCGFYNRGVKTAKYYVLRNTSASAILLELFYCDSLTDKNKYKNQDDKIARAIVRGLTGQEVDNKEDSVPVKKYNKKGVVTASTLNVRSSNSTSSKIVTTVKKDTLVQIKWTTNGWHYIILPNNKEGYVYAKYLNVLPSRYNCHNKNVPIKKTNNNSSQTLGYLGSGEVVSIKWTKNGWYYIVNNSNKEGYVEAGYLKSC